MNAPRATISAAPAQLRQGAAVLGRGWTQLVKPQQPAAAANLVHPIPGDYWERLISVAFTLTTSAVAGIRTLALAYADGDGYVFNLVPISNEIGPSQTLTGYGDLASVTPVQAPESHQTEGAQTSPGATTTICSLVLPSGGWTLNWLVMLTGTLAAADTDNFGLYQGTTLIEQSVNGIIVGQPYAQDPVEVQVPVGGATYAVKNVAAGTAASVYSAQLVASPANVMQLQVQIPDFVMKSGWQVQLQLGGAQAGDQLSGLGLLVERYPSSDIDHLRGLSADTLAEIIAGLMMG